MSKGALIELRKEFEIQIEGAIGAAHEAGAAIRGLLDRIEKLEKDYERLRIANERGKSE